MLEFLDFLRTGEIGWLTVTVRLVLAVFCGGFIGLERERKRRPAGFRTHILICLGACMATLTSQFLALELQLYTDMARLGAQVIAGIGFIGAGTIIITKRRQVKGLTTAAGLWTSAIIGLAIGAGYFEAALIGVAIVMIAALILSKFEYFIMSSAKRMNIYIEFDSPGMLDDSYRMINRDNVYFAGQMTGVEGYIESTSSGFVAGINAAYLALGKEAVIFPKETEIGALAHYVSEGGMSSSFQPMNANFGIIAPFDKKVKGGKKARNEAYAIRSLEVIKEYNLFKND